MKKTRVDDPILLAYEQGDYETALRLLPTLRKPVNIRTSYNIVPHIPDLANADDVTLLHLAAYNGWLDIVTGLVDEYDCDSKCCDSKGQTPLHYAAYSGSRSVVEYFISEQHCDPMHGIEHSGGTSLHCACLGGHLDLTKYLITEHGCDANHPAGVYGDTPLHAACSSKSSCLSVVKYLINEQHCDPNSKGQYGRTPLHYACNIGHTDIIDYLLSDLKYDLNLLDNDGDMPIHIASISGCLSIVEYFVNKQNCDPNSRGEKGRTPLHYASSGGHINIIQYLTKQIKCDPSVTDNDGDMPIHSASISGRLNAVMHLIVECHCDPNSRGESGRTPLHCACMNGHMDIMQYLLTNHQCDPTLPDDEGNKPIILSCLCGHLEMIKYFIARKHCNLTETGTSLLSNACIIGHMDIVRYLITQQSCDPTLPDENHNMPIHMACFGGHLHVVKYLITEHHCDSSSRGSNGYMPLHCACSNGHLDIVQYLIENQDCDPEITANDGLTPIYIATLNNHIIIVKYLIDEQRCDPNRRGINGRTLLHAACCSGHPDIVQYLIKEIGWDPEVTDNDDYVPLHMACFDGHLNVVKCLITEHHCNPTSRVRNGYTPLHFACMNGHLDVVQYLIEDQGCDPEITDNDGLTPIYVASLNNHMNILKYLINGQQCDPNRRENISMTPLHGACSNGHLDIVKYLFTDIGCDPEISDNDGFLPIHSACLDGQLEVVQYLVTKQHCDPNSKGHDEITPLHCACASSNLELIQYLVKECHCDPEIVDNNQRKPIHIACIIGRLHVVQYLIKEHHCDPNIRGRSGWTPLHEACKKGHMDIVQYLIKETDCSPEVVDEEGLSPLQVACFYGHTSVVKWLLQDERMNAERLDQYGHSLLHYAELSKNSFELLKLLKPLLKSAKDYPIQSFTKVVFTGNCGAGKSSLAQVIVKLANRDILFRLVPKLAMMDGNLFFNFTIEYQNMSLGEDEFEANPFTAGIDSYVLRSKRIGNIVLYDLAGQSEYYFSQSVIMETVMRKSPAIFINVVDLSKSDEEITQAVHYWLTFIVNAASKASGSSCVIMVGSHADVLSQKQLETKTTLVKDLMDRRIKKLNFDYFVRMDCRKGNDDNLFPILARCQITISANSQPVSIYCHMLYSFLQTKIDEIACQYYQLISYMSKEESLVPLDHSLLSDLLEYLSDKGLIIYLKNNQCLERSWIVIKREVILKDINGELYKPKYFRGHHQIASSTGIIRMSSLSELFPQYDLDMLVELMVGLEFCHPVDLSDMKTNLRPIESTSTEDAPDNFLFFPSLLKTGQSPILPSETLLSESELFRFGWCLGCMDYEYQFFTSRFLHVLLLRLAYTFPLPSENYAKTHALSKLERRCTVWTNGISWQNEDGISTVVEIIQQNRWVAVTMNHDKEMCTQVEYGKHRSAVIRLVLDLQKELVPDLDTVECLISPSLLQQNMPLDHLPESDLFVISDVAKSMLTCKPNILNYKDGTTKLATKQALLFEPYHLLSPLSVCELMDDSKSNQSVSSVILNEVRERCQMPQLEPQSYSSLRKHLDNISLFAGRNPLVSSTHNGKTHAWIIIMFNVYRK